MAATRAPRPSTRSGPAARAPSASAWSAWNACRCAKARPSSTHTAASLAASRAARSRPPSTSRSRWPTLQPTTHCRITRSTPRSAASASRCASARCRSRRTATSAAERVGQFTAQRRQHPMPPSHGDLHVGAHRADGLDTLRALAIVLVFAYHYMVFVSHALTFGWVSEIGWVGVDLFFVLSGYLIANQIFAGIAQGRELSLKAFYARRFLRTLPNFYVVLALYFLFPAVMGGNAPPPLWTFLSFTQNILLQPGTAFSHAWSLCIEEQFYLLLP